MKHEELEEDIIETLLFEMKILAYNMFLYVK